MIWTPEQNRRVLNIKSGCELSEEIQIYLYVIFAANIIYNEYAHHIYPCNVH